MSSTSLYDIPAASPPPGIQPNFTSPADSKQPTIVVVHSIFLSLMLVTVIVRFYSRGFLMHVLGWDDYICAVAAMFATLTEALGYHSLTLGWGNHLWDIRASVFLDSSTFRYWAIPNLFYALAMYSIKASVLVQYYRLFAISSKLRITLIWSLIFVSMTYAAIVGTQIAIVVQCTSMASFPAYPICAGFTSVQIFQGVFAVVTDFFILLLPVKSILRLQLPFRRKVGVLAIFCTGAVACLVSLTRLIATLITSSADFTYATAFQTIMITVEMHVAIMTACAPAMPAVFARAKSGSQSVYERFRGKLSHHSSPSSSFPAERKSTLLDRHHRSSVRANVAFDDGYIMLQEPPKAAILHDREGHRDRSSTLTGQSHGTNLSSDRESRADRESKTGNKI